MIGGATRSRRPVVRRLVGWQMRGQRDPLADGSILDDVVVDLKRTGLRHLPTDQHTAPVLLHGQVQWRVWSDRCITTWVRKYTSKQQIKSQELACDVKPLKLDLSIVSLLCLCNCNNLYCFVIQLVQGKLVAAETRTRTQDHRCHHIVILI